MSPGIWGTQGLVFDGCWKNSKVKDGIVKKEKETLCSCITKKKKAMWEGEVSPPMTWHYFPVSRCGSREEKKPL